MPPSLLARVRACTRLPRTRARRRLGIASITVAAVGAPLAVTVPTASAALRLLSGPRVALVSPAAQDAGRLLLPGAATPAPTPRRASTAAPTPEATWAREVPVDLPVIASLHAVAREVGRAASAVRRILEPTASPEPELRDTLIGPDGLDTAVGVYSDCSGATPLTQSAAAIDTCIAGPTYFVGHDVGVFTPLMSMSAGDVITWYDAAGVAHPWRIVSIRDNWELANGAPTPTQSGVVAQFQTCEPYSPSGQYDRIVDVVPD